MKKTIFAGFLAVLLAACATEDPTAYFQPPNPETQRVAYVEVRHDFGLLGAMFLFSVDGAPIKNPAFISGDKLPEPYRLASRSMEWSDGNETMFLAVPSGQRSLGYHYLPGMTARGFNPFDPGETIVPVLIEGTLLPGRFYRAYGEEGEERHSFHVWLEDAQTRQTVASMLVR